jgi:hypothetical protein
LFICTVKLVAADDMHTTSRTLVNTQRIVSLTLFQLLSVECRILVEALLPIHCAKSRSYEANDKKKRASNKTENVRTVHLCSIPVLYTVCCNNSLYCFFIDGTLDTLSNYHMHQLCTVTALRYDTSPHSSAAIFHCTKLRGVLYACVYTMFTMTSYVRVL